LQREEVTLLVEHVVNLWDCIVNTVGFDAYYSLLEIRGFKLLSLKRKNILFSYKNQLIDV
jgi:hypothetical protein